MQRSSPRSSRPVGPTRPPLPDPPPEIRDDETAVKWWAAIQSMGGFPQGRRDELFQGFYGEYRRCAAVVDGRDRGIMPDLPDPELRSALESCLSPSISPGTGTTSGRPGTALAVVPMLPRAMVEPIEREGARGGVAELAYRMGHELHADRARMLADDLAGYAEPPWSLAEWALALRAIRMDAALAKEVTFDRTITARVFALARERWAVRAGRPFTYAEACEACEGEAGFTFGELFTPCRSEDGEALFVLAEGGARRLDKRARAEEEAR